MDELKRHRGWKEIAAALGVSSRRAQQLALPEEGRLPLPVERDPISIFLRPARLLLWLEAEAIPYLKQLPKRERRRRLRRAA